MCSAVAQNLRHRSGACFGSVQLQGRGGTARQSLAPMAAARRGACTHVLFDMDGLLLDTERLYSVAQQAILDRFGLPFTWELKSQMMGKKALDAAQVLIDTLDLGDKLTAQEFVKEREDILDVLFAKAEVMPGVDRLIRHLAAHQVPMAVATSSHARHYQLKTGLHQDLFSLMSHVVTGDQVTKGKPDPMIFLTAASQFKGAPPSPSKCLVFEDAPTGVAAALAAGMWCVMVPDANLDPAHTAAAHQVLPSLEAFDPAEWGLPPWL